VNKEKVAELFRKADFYATQVDGRRGLTAQEDENWYMRSSFCIPSRLVPWDALEQQEVIEAMIPGPSPAALRALREYIEGLKESKKLAMFEDKRTVAGATGWARLITKPKVPKKKLYLQEDIYQLGIALGAISWHFITVGPKYVIGAFRARNLLMFAGPIIKEQRGDWA